MNRLYKAPSRYSWHQKAPFFLNLESSCKKTEKTDYRQHSTRQQSHASILHKIKHRQPLEQVHAQIIVSNLCGNVFLCNRLMNGYASCGLIATARIIFSRISSKNVVSWTILVSGLAKNGRFWEAIEVFSDMVVQEIGVNEVTIASVLPAIGKSGSLLMGKSVHCYWIRRNFEDDNVFVETCLVDTYSRFGCVGIARYLFDNMSVRNAVSWNAIISGYSGNGFWEEALLMFNKMRRGGFSGDVFTLMSLVRLEDIKVGRAIHGLIVRHGYEKDQLVKTALMELYIDCDLVNDAYSVFAEINERDLVSWTLMLRGFSKSSNWRRTIEHFNVMMGEGEIMLDSVSLITVLSGCSSAGALQQGRLVHSLVVKAGLEADVFVGSAVIDMYANCANILDAKRYFEQMEEKDAACWNTLISGYGMIGCGDDAINLFQKMSCSGLSPDESTYVSVLSACSHAGLVAQGLKIFDHMTEVWNVIPCSKHYACIVDLLGRAGRLNDAYSVIKRMHLQPGLDIYGALLNACIIHKNFDLGDEISQEIIQLKPNDAGYYVLISNMYALAGNQDGAKMARKYLKLKNLKKLPGLSSVEINGQMFTFMASQKEHPHYLEIKEFLKEVIFQIKAEGYEADINSVFQDVPDDVKRDILFHHSEKLAVAFGLMQTGPGVVIRVTKNLRICRDCHSACKFISKVYERVLLIKDAYRFHVFQDGTCSCRDWW